MLADTRLTFKSGLSIRYKFLLVTTSLLLFCVSVYLALASQIFKRDKTELVFDLTRSLVVNLSTETESLLKGVTDKMKLVALLSQDNKSQEIVKDLFENDSDIVFMARANGQGKLEKIFFQDNLFLQTYSLASNFYEQKVLSEKPLPLKDLAQDGQAIWNATLPDGPPLMGFSKSVVLESSAGDLTQSPFAVITLVRADRILKSSGQGRLTQVLVANQHGELLLNSNSHPKEPVIRDVSDYHLFKLAKSQPVRTGVAEYEQAKSNWLGAYSYAFDNRILVISQVPGEKAYAAVDRLLVRSLLFALIVATLAFIAAILFSRSLTRPILRLVEGMKRVAEGDLQTSIEVKSKDEIAVLANSFNAMISDLRQSRAELEASNRELEQKVLDRTQKLAEQNQTVKNAQEALLQTTRLAAVGEIAGRAAHEVLNPLTSIMTRLEKLRARVQGHFQQNSQMLSDIRSGWENDYQGGGFAGLIKAWSAPSALDPQATLWDEDLSNIKFVEDGLRQECNQLLTDTDFLLKEGGRINKIVQGMRSLTVVKGDWREHSVHKLVHESLIIMNDLSQHSRIEMIEAYHAAFDKVALDGDEFIQSLTNLIRNSVQSIKSSGMARGRIVLRTHSDAAQISVEIEDNGPGIERQYQAQLFEKQFSTKNSEEGTGLGLNISRRFIRAYGGDIILVKSEPGQTIFRIHLPLKLAEEQSA